MGEKTRKVGLIVAVLGTAALMGCGGASAGTAPPATAESATTTTTDADEATDDLVEHHRFHHHGGVTLLIAMSLDTLGVSPEQRSAVEKIRKDLHARMEPARAAEQSLIATLAEGVAAGNIDQVKVDAAIVQVTAAAAAVHDASADALNELHAVLTPEQRAALVDKLESHLAVWKSANPEANGATRQEGDHLSMLAADLALTEPQVESIRAQLGSDAKPIRYDSGEIKDHVKAFGDAFRTDKFDAKTFTNAGSINGRLAGWAAARQARLVETVAPIATPEQRQKLVTILRSHAAHDFTTRVSQ